MSQAPWLPSDLSAHLDYYTDMLSTDDYSTWPLLFLGLIIPAAFRKPGSVLTSPTTSPGLRKIDTTEPSRDPAIPLSSTFLVPVVKAMPSLQIFPE